MTLGMTLWTLAAACGLALFGLDICRLERELSIFVSTGKKATGQIWKEWEERVVLGVAIVAANGLLLSLMGLVLYYAGSFQP